MYGLGWERQLYIAIQAIMGEPAISDLLLTEEGAPILTEENQTIQLETPNA